LPPDRKSVIVGDNNKLNVNEVDDDFVAGWWWRWQFRCIWRW
jgi:hypothetical protein